MKRAIVTIETDEEYLLCGVKAFTEDGIYKKINKLCKTHGYKVVDFGTNRFVDKFPDYLDHRIWLNNICVIGWG